MGVIVVGTLLIRHNSGGCALNMRGSQLRQSTNDCMRMASMAPTGALPTHALSSLPVPSLQHAVGHIFSTLAMRCDLYMHSSDVTCFSLIW